MDGYVSIGVELNDKQFEKELKRLDKLTEKERKLKLEVESEGKIQLDLDRFDREYEHVWDKLEDIKSQQKYLNEYGTKNFNGDGFLDWKDAEKYKALTNEADKLDLKIGLILDKQQVAKNKLAEKNMELVRTQNEIDKINSKLDEAGYKSNNLNFKKLNESIKKAGDGIQGVIKKVGRWTMAVFGLRSAYMGIRRLMSTLSQYNKQISADLSYIQFSIAKAFEGMIQKIISGLYTALNYLHYILKAWFGITLFSNNSVKDWKKGQKAMGGMARSAKDLNKELSKMSFDEMNTLDKPAESGGGGGGVSVPNLDPRRYIGQRF